MLRIGIRGEQTGTSAVLARESDFVLSGGLTVESVRSASEALVTRCTSIGAAPDIAATWAIACSAIEDHDDGICGSTQTLTVSGAGVGVGLGFGVGLGVGVDAVIMACAGGGEGVAVGPAAAVVDSDVGATVGVARLFLLHAASNVPAAAVIPRTKPRREIVLFNMLDSKTSDSHDRGRATNLRQDCVEE